MNIFGEIAVTRKTGDEVFEINGIALQYSLLNFWQWSSSDIVGNALRGLLAEYIVASAMNANLGTRKEWEAFDVLSPEGLRIEVKSGAYIQSWEQRDYSKIKFEIAPKKTLEAESNVYTSDKARNSDIYVFCVLANKDQETLNPLSLGQWDFYVLKTEILDHEIGEQKSIGLSSLLRLNPIKTCYTDLRRSTLHISGKGKQ